MLTCQCGSTFLKKNKTQHVNTLKHKTWLKDETYAQRLDREMAQLIIDGQNIEQKMEPPKVEIDLENKDPLIVERGDTPRHPDQETRGAEGHRPSMNINIHCNRCNELKLALQVIGISMGITSFALVLWLIAKK
jgi:hypothetical protein